MKVALLEAPRLSAYKDYSKYVDAYVFYMHMVAKFKAAFELTLANPGFDKRVALASTNAEGYLHNFKNFSDGLSKDVPKKKKTSAVSDEAKALAKASKNKRRRQKKRDKKIKQRLDILVTSQKVLAAETKFSRTYAQAVKVADSTKEKSLVVAATALKNSLRKAPAAKPKMKTSAAETVSKDQSGKIISGETTMGELFASSGEFGGDLSPGTIAQLNFIDDDIDRQNSGLRTFVQPTTERNIRVGVYERAPLANTTRWDGVTPVRRVDKHGRPIAGPFAQF